MTNEGVRISVAVPVYNEEETVPELVRRIQTVLDELPGGPHEMLFVDDGSSDRTRDLLEQAAARDPRIAVVSLSRNFGHQAALSAALDHVSGDVTVLMDGDLQDPPEAIPKLLAKYEEGFDVVYARRAERKESAWLRMSYFLFYRLQSLLSDVRMPLDSGDFALLSRRVVDRIRAVPEYHRYLRGLRTWVGFRQAGVTVPRSERYAGKAKYGIAKLTRLAFDGIFAFSIVPLRAAAVLGSLAILLAGGFGLYAVYARVFLDRSPEGFTALYLTIFFLAGVNLLFLGIIGEYLGRVYGEVKSRPVYIVGSVFRQAPRSGATRAPAGTPSGAEGSPGSRAAGPRG